jgi:RNA recognition motif-containing protein
MPVSAEGKDAIESLNDISLGKKPLVVKEAEERSAPSGGARPGGFSKPGFNKPGGFNNNNRNRY